MENRPKELLDRSGTGSAAWELEKLAEKGIQELGDRAEY